MDPAGPPSTPSRRSIVTGAALAVPGIVAASAAPASAADVGPVPHLFVDSRLTWTGNPGARTFFFTITTYFADQNAVRTPYTDNTVEWYVDWFTS